MHQFQLIIDSTVYLTREIVVQWCWFVLRMLSPSPSPPFGFYWFKVSVSIRQRISDFHCKNTLAQITKPACNDSLKKQRFKNPKWKCSPVSCRWKCRQSYQIIQPSTYKAGQSEKPVEMMKRKKETRDWERSTCNQGATNTNCVSRVSAAARCVV